MAARRHWRFVVRDQYGFVIQNAKVNVYLPGTTTVFAGTAYDAASGGSPVTNPFTTNAFGEVEAWFDTAQVVDVQVDDNSNLAYRAVGGVSDTQDFPTFTEKDDIYVSASDQASLDFGEAGDMVATLVNPFTAVTGDAGATGEFADAAHVHPFTALTPAAPEKPNTTAAAGSGTDPAREDHAHGFGAAPGLTSRLTKTGATEEVLHILSVPADSVAVGSIFRIQFKGYQTNGTTACTFTFRLRWGGLAGTQIHSIAFVGTTTAHTDNPVNLEWLVTVQAIGASGSVNADVSGDECITTATANTPKLVLGPQTASVTVDTTATVDLALTVQLSTATGSPNIEVDNILIEQVA